VKGVVATTKDGIGPLCDVEVVETMVAHTSDGGLGGGNSHVVTTVVGIEEFPEGVTTFFSIAMCDTIWHS
jgi:hypothetical protein